MAQDPGTGQISDLLAVAATRPSALVIEGEPGSGKTTLWWTAVEQARGQGFHILQAWPGPTEVALTFATVVDLLGGADERAITALPQRQRGALDRITGRAAAGPAADERTVGAALLAVLEQLAADAPVLVAIDDAHWMDVASRTVLAFACRRLQGRVGVLLAVRTGRKTDVAGWLRLRPPAGVIRYRVPPLTLGGLHALLSAHLGRSLPRPTMVRIAEISSGNPFYALELARVLADKPSGAEMALPTSLNALVLDHIGRVDDDTGEVLLAVASAAEPTTELVARATGLGLARVVEMLEAAEDDGVLAIDGNRLRFTHPLWATGLYANASPARRRAMHRRLADLVEQPELRARHLGAAATSGDEDTLQALDAAADATRARGSPAGAAELLELAIRLGADDPVRRMRCAEHHFRAGDIARALATLQPAIDVLPPGPVRAIALTLLAGLRSYDNSYTDAVPILRQAIADADGNPVLEVQALMLLAFAHSNVGDYDDALSSVRQAVADAEQLGGAGQISQALAMWVVVNTLSGNGIDDNVVQRAVQLEDIDADVPIIFRASAENIQLLAMAGRLDEARAAGKAVWQHCEERGAESDLLFVAVHRALVEIWQGRFADAARIAKDAMERAEQLGGDHSLAIALTVRGLTAAYAGDEDQTHADTRRAIEAAQQCGSPRLADWPTMSLGFLQVSLGDYAAAITTLAPLAAQLLAAPQRTELLLAAFVPDVVEAMVALGRLADAEPLIGALERNGARLDRPWMLAIGARCRAMWLAAQGDVAAAQSMAGQAMVHHDRLPMPFETARTQLLLGQLQRRSRRKEVAARSLAAAVLAFEELGTPLWAQRARVELARTNIGSSVAGDGTTLTASELRVAELVASGMTNRDVAATLFISPKTVEFNLSRIYRKLGIRSRAQLNGRLAEIVRENPDSSAAPNP